MSAASAEKADKGAAKEPPSGEQPERMVQIINCWKTAQGLLVPKGKGHESIKIAPFGLSPPIPESLAKATVEAADKANAMKRKHGWMPYRWRMLEDEGNCGGKFTTKGAGGKDYKSCNKRNCPQPGHSQPGLHHTVQQAQALMAKMKEPEAIEDYINRFDQRPDVIVFGQQVAHFRRQELIKNMGQGSSRPFSPVN